MDNFKSVKQNQIRQYEEKCEQYLKVANIYLAMIIFGIASIIGLWIFLNSDEGIPVVSLILLGPLIGCVMILWKLREHALKSAILLDQLISELSLVLDKYIGDINYMKAKVLSIETRFLANDDELYTKKFIWNPFLSYMEEKATESNSVLDFIDVPNVWMRENPLTLDHNDADFVNLNWQIKMEMRGLYFRNYHEKYETLKDLGMLVQRNPIVFERFLRNKKISKLLKGYKSQTRIFYLSAAAKMKLITFVDSVLEKRTDTELCDEMRELVNEKNVQIQKYTHDFWKVHRRSILFYLFEFLWLILIVPVLIASLMVLEIWGIILATLVFFVGAAVVVFGEMMLITRQVRDLKSKKLAPSLIASLMAIRHSMCSNGETDEETTKTYQKYFKEAEKRYMLTVTEVEAVKYIKENMVVSQTLNETYSLRQKKEKQAQLYYQRFNHYRRQCLIYGALEALVALMIIPVHVIAIEVSVALGMDFVQEIIDISTFGLAILTEALLIRRHVRVSRRKELFLLIYQKMSVILSDDTVILDKERLVWEFEALEDSIMTVSEADDLLDVSDFVYKHSFNN